MMTNKHLKKNIKTANKEVEEDLEGVLVEEDFIATEEQQLLLKNFMFMEMAKNALFSLQ